MSLEQQALERKQRLPTIKTKTNHQPQPSYMIQSCWQPVKVRCDQKYFKVQQQRFGKVEEDILGEFDRQL